MQSSVESTSLAVLALGPDGEGMPTSGIEHLLAIRKSAMADGRPLSVTRKVLGSRRLSYARSIR